MYIYTIYMHLHYIYIYRQISNISRTLVGNKILRGSRSIACRRCSNYMYIFILDSTPDFNGLGNCKTRRITFSVLGLGVCLILEVLWYIYMANGEKERYRERERQAEVERDRHRTRGNCWYLAKNHLTFTQTRVSQAQNIKFVGKLGLMASAFQRWP